MGGDTPAAARPEVDAFELAGTGMLVTDESGLILRANRTYCDLVGRREREVVGQPFLHAFPKPAQPLVRRSLKAALGPGALPLPSHAALVRRDGRSVAVLLTIRATGDARPLAVITVTDVTALSATEARLTAVLEEQRLILDHAQVGILFSRSGRVMRTNAACALMFGYPESELIGLATTALVPAIDGTEPAGDEPWHAELEARHRDGTAFWCEIDGQPFSAPSQPVQSIWTLRDVTERRRAQEALARVLLDQRAILDNASVGIVFSRDRAVQRCNRKAEELFGYAPGELIGRPGRALYPDDETYAAVGQQAGPVLAAGESFQTELRLKRKDGSLFWCRMSATAVNPQAPHQETIWIGEDVTAQHAAQEALVRARDELEQRVVERTHDLADKNAELETEVAERRYAEERLQVRGERLLYHRNQLMALARRDRADLGESLAEVLATACTTLRLDRASYWRMLPDGRGVRCELVHRA
ncbi:MAG TPA: PAS domain S-box protein, partial [Burkholderiales bacterium]|nr:PAS domain S-box protein [Burkholderiales bacterium]